MKQPEFRFWHKEHKEMMIADQLEWVHGILTFVMADHLHEAWCFKAHEVELMQWTGLIDDVGQKIYDGDIILLDQTLFSADKPKRCEVYWAGTDELHTAGWQLYCLPGINGERGGVMRGFELGMYKVLGNKYGNPELMK